MPKFKKNLPNLLLQKIETKWSHVFPQKILANFDK